MRYEKIMSLKWLARTGWMQRGIPPSAAETVAAHTFEVAILAHTIAARIEKSGGDINIRKVLELALYHDVPEAIEGDIVKWVKDRLPRDVAKSIEAGAAEAAGIPVTYAKEMTELSTLEAQIVKLADNLATCLQAIRYSRLGYDVTDILEATRGYVTEAWASKFPELRKYADVVRAVVEEVGCSKKR